MKWRVGGGHVIRRYGEIVPGRCDGVHRIKVVISQVQVRTANCREVAAICSDIRSIICTLGRSAGKTTLGYLSNQYYRISAVKGEVRAAASLLHPVSCRTSGKPGKWTPHQVRSAIFLQPRVALGLNISMCTRALELHDSPSGQPDQTASQYHPNMSFDRREFLPAPCSPATAC